MNTGVVILVAAFCFRMIVMVVQQLAGFAVVPLSSNLGVDSVTAVLAVSNGLGAVANLALAVGCAVMAVDKRALPFGIGGAAGWVVCVASAAAVYLLGMHGGLVSVVWIAGAVAALTLTVAGAEAVRGEIRIAWVAAVGVLALGIAATPPILAQVLAETSRYEMIRGIFFLGDIFWVALLIAIVVVTLVPALSEQTRV